MRTWPALLALMLLAPTALASSTFAASSLTFAGEIEIRGQGNALFAVADSEEFAWDLTASSATLTRTYSELRAVHHPLKEGEWLYSETGEWETSQESFLYVQLTSLAVEKAGALLVTATAAELATASSGLVEVAWASDPRIVQSPSDAAAPGGDKGVVSTQLVGEYARISLSEGVATVVGDITIHLFGPDYTLTSGTTSRDELTGDSEGNAAGPAVTNGRRERQEIVLTNAVFRIRSTEGIEAYTASPEVSFSGTLSASGAEGALVLDAEVVAPTNGAFTWSGASTLTLTPASGKLLADSGAATLATTGAIVDSGPRIAIVSAALAVIAIGALAALVALRLRSRRDDLATALLAMEDRRWSDAIPPLNRLAKKEPTNATILIDRALSLEQAGRVRDAAKAFETALRAAPRHAEAHFYYARTLAKMSESEAARVHLETALENDPRLVELARREQILRGI